MWARVRGQRAAGFAISLPEAQKWALQRLRDEGAQVKLDREQVRPDLARAAKGPR